MKNQIVQFILHSQILIKLHQAIFNATFSQ